MMEVINSDYMNFPQAGVQLNLSSSYLSSLATPPRRTHQPANKKTDSHIYKFCSPPQSRASNNTNFNSKSTKGTRISPSRLSPCQHGFYSGAKFGERPPPTELPKPPNHWMRVERESISLQDRELLKEQSCIEMTNNLKVLLKVQS